MRTNLVALGELADFVNGAAFKPEDWGESGLPIIRIQNLTDPGKPFNYTERPVPRKLVVEPGDLLVSWSATLGVFQWEGPRGLLNQHIFRVLPDSSVVDRGYFKHALGRAMVEMERHLHGATMKHVNRGEFLGTKIPLPSLEEQRRIAAILDKAANLDLLARVSTNAQAALNEAIFLEMFGNPAEHQGSWPVAPLGEVARLENGDRSSNYPSGDDIKDEGIPFLSTKNIVDNRLNLASLAYITPEKFGSLTQGKARKGDLLITLRGTLGSCCIFSCSHETAFINAQMMLIRPGDRLLPTFLHSLLTTTAFQAKLQSLGYGAAVRQLSSGQLSGLSIPVPPISLQEDFRRRLGRALEVSSTCKKRHQEIKELISSLQSQAFCGYEPT